MKLLEDAPAEIAASAVAASWLGIFVILALGNRRAAKGDARRDPKSRVGFILQCAAFASSFVFARTYFTPFLTMSKGSEYALAALTIALAIASVWFCYAAAMALGRQWALMARVIEGHELIRQGPYAFVRNPIYLAMLGILIATGLAISRWQALAVATVIFAAGTAIRIHAEENLLREAFGPGFEEYARRVPAFLPRLLP